MIQILFGAKHTSNISTEMNQHIQILTNKQTNNLKQQNYCNPISKLLMCSYEKKKYEKYISIYTHFESKILIN